MTRLASMAVVSAILISLGASAGSAKQLKAKIVSPPPAGPTGLATRAPQTSAILTENCSYGNDYLSHCTVYKEDGSKYGEYCVDNNGKTISCP